MSKSPLVIAVWKRCSILKVIEESTTERKSNLRVYVCLEDGELCYYDPQRRYYCFHIQFFHFFTLYWSCIYHCFGDVGEKNRMQYTIVTVIVGIFLFWLYILVRYQSSALTRASSINCLFVCTIVSCVLYDVVCEAGSI